MSPPDPDKTNLPKSSFNPAKFWDAMSVIRSAIHAPGQNWPLEALGGKLKEETSGAETWAFAGENYVD
jgi:hypothetical protein